MLEFCMEMYLHKYSSCEHLQVLMKIQFFRIFMLAKNCTTCAPVQVKLQLPDQGLEMIPPEQRSQFWRATRSLQIDEIPKSPLKSKLTAQVRIRRKRCRVLTKSGYLPLAVLQRMLLTLSAGILSKCLPA